MTYEEDGGDDIYGDDDDDDDLPGRAAAFTFHHSCCSASKIDLATVAEQQEWQQVGYAWSRTALSGHES